METDVLEKRKQLYKKQ